MGEAHQDGKRHEAGDACSSTEVSSPADGQQEVPHRSKSRVSSHTKIKGSDLSLAGSMNILFGSTWPPCVDPLRDPLACDNKQFTCN